MKFTTNSHLGDELGLKNGLFTKAKQVLEKILQENPNDEASKNLLQQLAGEKTSSNTTISLKGFDEAKLITLAGSFNDWNPIHTIFIKKGKVWETSLDLAAGTYEYKLVVDGNWILDPDNKEKKSDGNGNVNSVLTVTP